MPETKHTLALIINRQAYRENDSLVTVYSRDLGKINLVARGTQKLQSKLAAHIEPLILADIMIIPGRGYDYIGSSIMRKVYIGIRNDLNKLYYAGQGISLFDRLVGKEQQDEPLFLLLSNYLDLLDNFDSRVDSLNKGSSVSTKSGELILSYFILRLLSLLGYQPEMYNCLDCGKLIKSGGNFFSLSGGGIVCNSCQTLELFGPKLNDNLLAVSDNLVKIIRFMINNEFNQVLKLRISKKLITDLGKLLHSFIEFCQ